jgi:hypothetical protein
LPIATTKSPTSSSSELPSGTECSLAPPVLERHQNIVGLCDDVVVGENVAFFGIDDHSGPDTLHLAPDGLLGQIEKTTKRRIFKELAEPRVIEKRGPFDPYMAARRDIDDTRRHVLHKRRQRRYAARLRWKFGCRLSRWPGEQ